jgi:hypothetical protein
MKRIAISIALIGLLVVAAPAAASSKQKTLYYDGETVAGNSFSFELTGKRISNVDGYVAASCVPNHGPPLVFSTEFNPPGSYVLGKTRKASETEYMSYKGDVTKNYTISIKKQKGRLWIADLHVNYSYEEVVGVSSSELEARFYICQGDDEFRFIV